MARRNELAKLERRIDWLEFELRKSLHQIQQQQQQLLIQQAPAATNNQAAGSGEAGAQEAPGSSQPGAAADSASGPKLIDLSERLNLVEKFITITTSKVSWRAQCEFCHFRPTPDWVHSQPARNVAASGGGGCWLVAQARPQITWCAPPPPAR